MPFFLTNIMATKFSESTMVFKEVSFITESLVWHLMLDPEATQPNFF